MGVNEDESVEELLEKLQKKGKKVKLVEEGGKTFEVEQSSDEDVPKTRNKKPNDEESAQRLEEEKKMYEEHKAKMEDAMRAKDQEFEQANKEKSQLADMIKELENKLVVGGSMVEDKEHEQMQK